MQAAVAGKKKFKLLVARGGGSANALQEGPVAQAKVSGEQSFLCLDTFGQSVFGISVETQDVCTLMYVCAWQAEILENIRSTVKVSLQSSFACCSLFSIIFADEVKMQGLNYVDVCWHFQRLLLCAGLRPRLNCCSKVIAKIKRMNHQMDFKVAGTIAQTRAEHATASRREKKEIILGCMEWDFVTRSFYFVIAIHLFVFLWILKLRLNGILELGCNLGRGGGGTSSHHKAKNHVRS